MQSNQGKYITAGEICCQSKKGKYITAGETYCQSKLGKCSPIKASASQQAKYAVNPNQANAVGDAEVPAAKGFTLLAAFWHHYGHCSTACPAWSVPESKNHRLSLNKKDTDCP